jgi:hypothetical protein
LICREGFRDKIAKPLTGVIMTRVLGVLECLEKLCKSLRPSTVFGRTTSLSCYADLLKRFVSNQNLFKKPLVPPAVPEIILVQ